MRIREYTRATSIDDTDAFIVETSNGTRYAEKQDLNYLDASGDTMTGVLEINTGTTKGTGQDNNFTGDITAGQIKIGGNVDIRSDQEGGNIRLTSPDGKFYEMDAYNGNLRIWGGEAGKNTQLLGKGISPTTGYLDLVYPVGAVYISYVSTSPASLFGGTWTQITGRVLRAANDVSIGGSDTHTMTIAEMAAHSHWGDDWACIASGEVVNAISGTWSNGNIKLQRNGYQGSSTPYSTLPAYQDLYVWRRTA